MRGMGAEKGRGMAEEGAMAAEETTKKRSRS